MQSDDKRESTHELSRGIEQELAQKRAQWQRDRGKYRLIRLLSFSFLSIVILGTMMALFWFFAHSGEMRAARDPSPAATAIPSPSIAR